ncbi:MAG: adenylate/guanylate cyclase domain-containing protein [Hyphomicrobiales bacterium]|nr:adenylate/guanylate cyclase domain-containing protein [Hyphomicrobiales bacterium]
MNDERIERRLAAILAGDVVGYSRLMGADEVGTLRALKVIRRELADPAVARHHGRIVKTTGDGILIEFPSVVDAVICAINIQRGMIARNACVPEDKRIVFRIGINVGDIIIDEGDIYGDGVNIAARLEALCEPGGLCISRTANDQIRDKLSLAFADLGEQTVKNIARAVGVYGVGAKDIAALAQEAELDAIETPAGERSRDHQRKTGAVGSPSVRDHEARPTLAVLPFDNLSRDDEIEGFCDGLAEDVTTAVSKFRWIKIVSRNSSFAYKGHSIDVRRVAGDLGVRYILEGSVRRAGHRVRITAQLIDGASGNHLWAEKYDRDYSNPFDLQDEITRDLVASLEHVLWVTLVRGDPHTGAPDPVLSPLRAAGWHIVELTHVGNRAAIACASSALEINPKSVAAYQYLANAYIAELFAGWTEDAASDIGNLMEAGRRATALSPADALSQCLYGVALSYAGNHDDGLACARRALALNSNSVNVLGPCGRVLTFYGEVREANQILERTLRLAPAHYFRAFFLSHMALNWLQLGEPERGLPLISEATKLKPEALCCYITQAQILQSLGRLEPAKGALSEAYRRRPDLNEGLVRAMFPYRDCLVSDRLVEALPIA